VDWFNEGFERFSIAALTSPTRTVESSATLEEKTLSSSIGILDFAVPGGTSMNNRLHIPSNNQKMVHLSKSYSRTSGDADAVGVSLEKLKVCRQSRGAILEVHERFAGSNNRVRQT
jgi:hypothetical protein